MGPANRLYVALGLPDGCRRALAALDPGIPGVRWLAPRSLHLTLRFVGDVAAAVEERLAGALEAVRVPPFVLPLAGIGWFGRGGRPTVVWVGVGKGHPHLFALHRKVQDAALRAGLDADLSPFRPHVTVGRCKGVAETALRAFLRRHEGEEFGMFRVSGFGLYSGASERMFFGLE